MGKQMKKPGLLMVVLITAISGRADPDARTLAEQLIAANAVIQTVRCDIRRETLVDGRRVHTLSRVWYARPDRLRVETVTPEPRRILVDGTTIHKWVEGHAEGVRIPLAEAAEGDLLQVRKVPGTAEDYLLRLRGGTEQVLEPTGAFPERRGYQLPDSESVAELEMDTEGRLARITLFAAADRDKRLMQVEFSAWREPQPGIRFPVLQKAVVDGPDGKAIRETLRVSALVVNEPLEASLFDITLAAKDIRFVSVDAMNTILAEREKK